MFLIIIINYNLFSVYLIYYIVIGIRLIIMLLKLISDIFESIQKFLKNKSATTSKLTIISALGIQNI